jgi:hypothetical protein
MHSNEIKKKYFKKLLEVRMVSKVYFELEKIIIPFEKDQLIRWKMRDSSLVPEYALNWAGNGVSNGFGFGEWHAEQYFRSKGYYVINDEYDLFSKRSKYKVYNEIIVQIVGKDKAETFRKAIRYLNKQGYKTENLDLFVFDTNTSFFVEAKKGRDELREPQLRFMYLAKKILNVECKLVYLSETEHAENKTKVKIEELSVEVEIPATLY